MRALSLFDLHHLRTHHFRTHRTRVAGCGHGRKLSGTALILAGLMAVPTSVPAQTVEPEPGQAVVTRFAGTSDDGGPTPVIDLSGAVANLVDLRAPGAPAAGQPLQNIPASELATAAEVGQVFGIALDDDGNVYLTATSAFGLHRDESGDDWMAGQWGLGGGPGTVYKLDADNDYAPSVFADIQLAGRKNTGAGLGNIVFDREHDQFFVSDLETGMIHRLDMNGQDLGHYDHGTTGRASFIEASNGAPSNLPQVAFDPASEAAIDDCAQGDFVSTPACWNFADFRRRAWGMAINDEGDGNLRLYYAVWASQSFGNPAWPNDTTDQQNAVWSVGLDENGAFAAGSTRREFLVPGFFATMEDYNRAGGSHAITDMAFSGGTDLVLAERGAVRNLGLDQDAPFATPLESRVLRYQRNTIWLPLGRHDVGKDDREDQGQPFLRAAASGGVDFGPGYDGNGMADGDRFDGFIWFTGDQLCGANGICPDGQAAGTDDYAGLQGQARSHVDELAPAAAYTAYPAPGPATAPVGPSQSYFVGMQPDAALTFVGDIEIFGAGGLPGDGAPDLAVAKVMPEVCEAGQPCVGRVTVTNVGTAPWNGPIFLRDIVEPPAGMSVSVPNAPWICEDFGPILACYHQFTQLNPGDVVALDVVVQIPASFNGTSINNCAAVLWPLASTESRAIVRSVQTALRILGYDAGPVDGSIGPRTQGAIAQFQQDLGLTATGVIDNELLEILFSGNAGQPNDGNPDNDRACDTSDVDRPSGVHLPVGSQVHQPPGSQVHQPPGSVHQPPGSVHLPAGSVHQPPGSVHLPAGSVHQPPGSVHLPIGSDQHLPFQSNLHNPAASDPHLPIGSNQHLPVGSNLHNPAASDPHLPIGSNQHLPIQSNLHNPIASNLHLPIGSNQHLPVGSNLHNPAASDPHLPIGSNQHQPGPSLLHNAVGSGNVIQPEHKPDGSVHSPPGSLQHNPVLSNGVKVPEPHLPAGSNQHQPGPSLLHNAVGSNNVIQPEHQPPGSVHTPPGSAHTPPGSNLQRVPEPTHQPAGSVQTGPTRVTPETGPQHLPAASLLQGLRIQQ